MPSLSKLGLFNHRSCISTSNGSKPLEVQSAGFWDPSMWHKQLDGTKSIIQLIRLPTQVLNWRGLPTIHFKTIVLSVKMSSEGNSKPHWQWCSNWGKELSSAEFQTRKDAASFNLSYLCFAMTSEVRMDSTTGIHHAEAYYSKSCRFRGIWEAMKRHECNMGVPERVVVWDEVIREEW